MDRGLQLDILSDRISLDSRGVVGKLQQSNNVLGLVDRKCIRCISFNSVKVLQIRKEGRELSVLGDR